MENETISKNFIENIIDKDLAEAYMIPYTHDFHRNLTAIFISAMPNLFF